MSTSKVPQLPPTDDSEANSLRYAVNPAIALNALTDIYKQVQQYQGQLQQLAHQIHQIYAEGPVVSGWLASEASLSAVTQYSNTPTTHPFRRCPTLDDMNVALFRHGDADDLMNYLSALENTMLAEDTTAGSSVGSLSKDAATVVPEPRTGSTCTATHKSSQYYLCQLNSSGQIQAEQCPHEQVPVLSMAIARYRRLNQLITQKQAIETKLQTIVDILGDAQAVLAIPL